MSTHNLFWAEIWKISEFLSENFQFLIVKFSIYLNRRVFIMSLSCCYKPNFSSRKLQLHQCVHHHFKTTASGCHLIFTCLKFHLQLKCDSDNQKQKETLNYNNKISTKVLLFAKHAKIPFRWTPLRLAPIKTSSCTLQYFSLGRLLLAFIISILRK